MVRSPNAIRTPRASGRRRSGAVGYSSVGRDADRTAGGLPVDACLAALKDSGLTPKDVDGIATYPGGYDSVPVFHVTDALGIDTVNWFSDLFGYTPAGITPVTAASHAVALGHCDVALAYRSLKRHGPPGLGYGGPGRLCGDLLVPPASGRLPRRPVLPS